MNKGTSGLRVRDKASYALSAARGVFIQYDLKEYRPILEKVL